MAGQSEGAQFAGLTAADLQVYLLGPPEVVWAGHPLAIPRRQVRALLYCLATWLAAVPRDQLCFLFWPDTSDSTARRNLSHLLTHLRRALPDPDLLLTPDDRIKLDIHRTWSDTSAFEHLCSTSDLHHLQQAVDLYRGSFLAGFSLSSSPEFEAWVTQEQPTWERLYLEALATLIEDRTAKGLYDDAIAYAQRYLETDDLAEEVHRRLIQLYAAAGNRSDALNQFERCAAALERELGVRPLPETRAAYEAVLEDRPPQLLRPAGKLTWTTLPGLDVPLVGRDEALQNLEQACARAQVSHGGVVLISGEAGIGKSRLMQDFTSRLADQVLVLMGAGQPGAQTPPYHPIAQALRSALSLQPSTFNLQPIWLAEIARLLPELRTLYPDLPAPLPAESDEARVRLFEALCRFSLALADSRLVLLCLDDLHWMDGATLDWLTYLGPHLRDSRLLILGTYRSEEAGAVTELRHNLMRLTVVSDLKLAGLDATAVLHLLRHLIGPVRSDDVLPERLQEATGGNPFFLLETLRVLIEAGQSLEDLADLRELPLPDTIRAAVKARLQHLSSVARQVLEAGAVLGTTFGFDLVRLTAGRRELETMDSLDELVARQLLVEQDTNYRFQHDLTRRIVEASLSPVRRQLLHRRAGRALEQHDRHAVVALAHHFDTADDPKRALHYHALAAQRAEALFAWQEAEGHQDRMLTLLDRLDPDCSQPDYLAQRGRVLADRAHQRFLQGRLAERDADLAALVDLAEASGEKNLRLQALAHQVRYLNLDAQYKQAIAAAEEGLLLAGHLDNTSARCRFLSQVGFAHYFLGQPQPALTALESALALAGDDAPPEVRGRITHILGYVHFHLGNYAQSLAYQQDAHACHEAIGDYNRMAWDGLDIGALYLEMGHLTEARQHLTENLALARRVGARPAEAYGLTLLGSLELHWGDYVVSGDWFQQAFSMQQELRSDHGRVAAELGMGLVAYHLDDPVEARHRLESAIERARSIGHSRRLAESLSGLGLAEIAAGQVSTARRYLTEAVAVARGSECWECVAVGLAALARTERLRDDPASALSCAREAVCIAREGNLPVCEMLGEMEAGLAVLAQGEPEAALQHMERAVSLVTQAHEAWIGTEEVHHAHALVLRSLGRIEAAYEQVRLADVIIEAKAGRIPDPEVRRRYLQASSARRSLNTDNFVRSNDFSRLLQSPND